MTNAKLRWLFILFPSFFLLMMSYQYYLSPAFNHLYALQAVEQTLIDDIRSTKLLLAKQPKKQLVSVSGSVLPQNEIERLNDLIANIHLHDLLIQSLRVLPQHSVDELLTHVMIEGDLQGFYVFLVELEKQRNIFIKNFSFTLVGNDKLRSAFDVSLFNHYIFPISHELQKRDKEVNPNEFSVPLAHMRMVGYLQQGNHRQAWIALPNKTILTIDRGALLGKEKGVVADISAHQTIIVLPNKKHMIIKFFR